VDRRIGRPESQPGLPILVAIVTAQLVGAAVLVLIFLWLLKP
jgi:hypothetical protein